MKHLVGLPKKGDVRSSASSSLRGEGSQLGPAREPGAHGQAAALLAVRS